mmetsp:Transcript_10564/g.42643  ORF Transcript_10564/g.42643 Transcript_10564/m.42643 type:complete len:288 (-) Transcript_10564:491-1354(-)
MKNVHLRRHGDRRRRLQRLPHERPVPLRHEPVRAASSLKFIDANLRDGRSDRFRRVRLRAPSRDRTLPAVSHRPVSHRPASHRPLGLPGSSIASLGLGVGPRGFVPRPAARAVLRRPLERPRRVAHVGEGKIRPEHLLEAEHRVARYPPQHKVRQARLAARADQQVHRRRPRFAPRRRRRLFALRKHAPIIALPHPVRRRFRPGQPAHVQRVVVVELGAVHAPLHSTFRHVVHGVQGSVFHAPRHRAHRSAHVLSTGVREAHVEHRSIAVRRGRRHRVGRGPSHVDR